MGPVVSSRISVFAGRTWSCKAGSAAGVILARSKLSAKASRPSRCSHARIPCPDPIIAPPPPAARAQGAAAECSGSGAESGSMVGLGNRASGPPARGGRGPAAGSSSAGWQAARLQGTLPDTTAAAAAADHSLSAPLNLSPQHRAASAAAYGRPAANPLGPALHAMRLIGAPPGQGRFEVLAPSTSSSAVLHPMVGTWQPAASSSPSERHPTDHSLSVSAVSCVRHAATCAARAASPPARSNRKQPQAGQNAAPGADPSCEFSCDPGSPAPNAPASWASPAPAAAALLVGAGECAARQRSPHICDSGVASSSPGALSAAQTAALSAAAVTSPAAPVQFLAAGVATAAWLPRMARMPDVLPAGQTKLLAGPVVCLPAAPVCSLAGAASAGWLARVNSDLTESCSGAATGCWGPPATAP